MSSIGQEPAAVEAAIAVGHSSDHSPPVNAEEEQGGAFAEIEENHEPAEAEAAPATEAEAEVEDAVVVDRVTELKAAGTTLFRRRDYNGAASKFDEAIRCSPRARARGGDVDDDDVAALHSNVAACYMHMTTDPEEEERRYHQAIDRCNMALAASPRYTKALLKRARCFEALDHLDLACGDVQEALTLEPNNVVALDLLDSIREEMEERKLLLEQEVSSLNQLLVAISTTALDMQRKGSSTPPPVDESHGGQLEKDSSYGNGGEDTHIVMSSSEEGEIVGGGDEKKKQQEHEGAESTDADGRGHEPTK